MSPSRVPEGESRGHIVPIGGAENKENDPKILARFVQVSGGGDADIVVIPTASRAHETGERYEKIFRELGASASTSWTSTRAATARSRAGSTASAKRPASSSPAATSSGSRRCSAARRSRS